MMVASVVTLISIIVIGAFFYRNSLRTSAANPPLSVQFKEATNLVLAPGGTEGKVSVYFNSLTEKVSAGTVVMNYPKNLVSFSRISLSDCDELGGTNTTVFTNDDGNGRLEFTVLFSRDNDQLPSGFFCFADVFFLTGTTTGSGDAQFVQTTDPAWEIVGPGSDLTGIQFNPNLASPEKRTIVVQNQTPSPTNSPTPTTSSVPSPTPTTQASPTATIVPSPPITAPASPTPTTNPTLVPTKTPTPTPTTKPPTLTPAPTNNPTATPTTKPNPTATPTNTIAVNFSIRLQGILSVPKTKSSVPITVSLAQGTSVRNTRSITFTAGSNGIWNGSASYTDLNPASNYIVLLKGPHHLQKKICANSPTESVAGSYDCSTGTITLSNGTNTINAGGITMLAGDLPLQDGVVDSQDIVRIRTNFGKTDPDTLAFADLNYDGIVDTQDYSLIIAALSFKYDQEVN